MLFLLKNADFLMNEQDPPERPKGKKPRSNFDENFQLWSKYSNEFCPEGTVPIRRTRVKDMVRASNIQRFGKKIRPVQRDTSSNGHEVISLPPTFN